MSIDSFFVVVITGRLDREDRNSHAINEDFDFVRIFKPFNLLVAIAGLLAIGWGLYTYVRAKRAFADRSKPEP